METRPSRVFLFLLLASFIGFSTLSPLLQCLRQPYQRAFQDNLWHTHKAADFRHLQRMVSAWQSGNPLYGDANGYAYPPQGLPLLWPLMAPGFPAGYFCFLATMLLGLGSLYLALSRRLSKDSALGAGIVFLSVFGLSQPSLYLLERGNADGIAAVLVLGALALLMRRRYGAAAVALGCASCLKSAYLPLAAILWILPRRWRWFGVYGGTHLLFGGLAVAVYGSWALVPEYLRAIPVLIRSQGGSFGAMNLSLPAALAVFSRELGWGDGARLMNGSTSLVVLGGLLALGWILKGNRRGGRWEGFGFLLLVTALWQFRFSTYGAMILLPLIPLADRIQAKARNGLRRWAAVGCAAALALVFAPAEFRLPILGTYRGGYLLLVLALWSFLIGWGRRCPSYLIVRSPAPENT